MSDSDSSKPSNEQLSLLGTIKQANTQLSKSKASENVQSMDDQEIVLNHSNLPQKILVLDTETSGLDALNDKCLEVGAILFHLETRSVLSQHSFLLPVNKNPAETINKIPANITRLSQPWREAIIYFETLVAASDLVVAHNASFDRQWFGQGVLPQISKPWLCSMEDISWPLSRVIKARPSVRDLALAYEVPVWSAHRALTDCIYLVEVFRRCDDLETLILHGLEPRKLMKACVSYEDRHLAKLAGFTWNDPVPGVWSRRLSDREVSLLGFRVKALESN